MATPQATQKLHQTTKTNLNFNFTSNSEYHPHTPPVNTTNIERHKKTILIALSKHLYTYEIEHILNDFRRSTVTDTSVLADFFNGDIRRHNVIKDDNYYRALQYTADAFRPPRKCRPVHLMDVYDRYPFKLDVSAETPFVSDPKYRSLLPDKTVRLSFGNMKHLIFSFCRRWIHEIKENQLPPRSLIHVANEQRHIYPMLLHSKTALIDIDDPNKMRTIWGASKIMILAQVMIYWSYFAWAKKHRNATPLLWGYETMTGGWFRLNAELFTSFLERSFLMIDWKRFDKYAEFTVIRDINRLRRDYFTFSDGYEPTQNYPDTTPVNPKHQEERLNRVWHWILEYYFNAEIILPDGRKFIRTHAGIPSGVYTTQLDDSQYNCVMLTTILFAMSVSFDAIKLMGDDSLVRLLTCIPPNMHESFLTEMQRLADYYFGSVISTTKSRLNNRIQGCEVLSYTNNHGLPFRNELEALATLYHTKARSPSPAYTMSAAIGYAYALPMAQKRFYLALKDIYTYYESKGFTPDARYLAKIGFFTDVDFLQTLDVSTFPTRIETRHRLMSSDYISAQMKQFWPTDYFLSDV